MNETKGFSIGRYLSVLRERAGVTQAAVAKSMKVSPAMLSRIESGERPVTPQEVAAYLKAVGTPEAIQFREYLQQDWKQLEPPAFDHPDRELLWEANLALSAAREFHSRLDPQDAFPRQVEVYEDELRRILPSVQSRQGIVAIVGNIGVGKSTTICRITGLEVPGEAGSPPQPALEVGAGGITLCEVHIERGPEYGLLVEPRTEEDIKAHVEDYCEALVSDISPERVSMDPKAETWGISGEMVRAIRNMANLGQQRVKGADGKVGIIDRAKELARALDDSTKLFVEVLSRLELPRRDRRDLWYPHDSAKPMLVWLKDTFAAINNGRHPECSLPKRIEVIVPTPVLETSDLDIRLIDTKGIDQTAERADLINHFDDPNTIVILCSRFNDAPEVSTQQLLKRVKDAGVRDIQRRVGIVVLPRPDESRAMKYDDGTVVADDDEGYALKREQIERRIQPLELGDIAVLFFNARRDNPAVLKAFVLDRINQLRDGHRERVRQLIGTIREAMANHENAQAQAVLRSAAERLNDWINNNRELGSSDSPIHEDLIAAMQNARASTLHAAIRREGEWPDLDYMHYLGCGACKIAAKLISIRLRAFRATAQELIQDPEMSDARSFVQEAVQILESAVDESLKKIYLLGKSAYSFEFKNEYVIWGMSFREWGKPTEYTEYKSEVIANHLEWFEADERKSRDAFVKIMMTAEWNRALDKLKPLLQGMRL